MELCEALIKAGAGALKVEGTVWVGLLYGKERDPGMWLCRLIKGYLPLDVMKQVGPGGFSAQFGLLQR